MKKTYKHVRILKVDSFDRRLLIATLNEYRKKQKAAGIDNTVTCDLILKLIDAQ